MGIETTPMVSGTVAMLCRSIPVLYYFCFYHERESRFLVGEDDRQPVPFRHMHPAYAMTSIASMQCCSHGCVFCR